MVWTSIAPMVVALLRGMLGPRKEDKQVAHKPQVLPLATYTIWLTGLKPGLPLLLQVGTHIYPVTRNGPCELTRFVPRTSTITTASDSKSASKKMRLLSARLETGAMAISLVI